MDRKSILTKTAKGLMEATGKTSDLSRDLRNLLKEIDGKVSVGQLQMRQELFTEAKFMDALRALERDGYVREMPPAEPLQPRGPGSKPPGSETGEDLDFTAIASRSGAKSAAEISRQIAGERERVEAAAKAKAEAEARAKAAAYESEERRKREESEHVHREAEARAKAAAEEKSRREAEEKARREAEERAKREAADRARREVEEKAKREAEERRRHEEERRRREEEERRRREAAEKAQREEEERRRREEEKRRKEEEDERRRKEEDRRRWEIEARAEAAELEAQLRNERAGKPRSEAAELEEALRQERAEAEERVRRENEERVRREEEERRREQEEASLKPAATDEAEEEIRRREEEMRRREQDEAARTKQEAKARAEADAQATAQARKGAEAREKGVQEDDRRAKAQEAARQTSRMKAYRPRRNLGKPIATTLFFVLVLSAVALHFVPIDSAPYEKAAQEWLGQPVRIGTVNVALVPSPHLRFEKVVIGEKTPLRVATARGSFALTSLFDDRKVLRRIEIEGATVPQAFLPAVLAGASAGGPMGIERVTGKGIRLEIPGFAVPDLEIDAALDRRGSLTGVRFVNAERKLTATLQPQAGRATLEIAADKFAIPIGGNLSVDEFSAKGTVGRTDLAFSEFEGRALNGIIQGNARLRWADGWSLDGEFSVKQMDAAKIAAPIVATGKLEGKGVYGMKAAAPDKLFEAARMEGQFTIQKGSITNVDMTRILQGSSTGGGTTLFSEMSGSASAESGRIHVRQLRMAAGLLQGAGSVDVDPQKNLSGRVQIELRAQTVQARATLALTGSLRNPQFRRTN